MSDKTLMKSNNGENNSSESDKRSSVKEIVQMLSDESKVKKIHLTEFSPKYINKYIYLTFFEIQLNLMVWIYIILYILKRLLFIF